MLAIALTGGIGSGKTAVTKQFQQLAAQSEYHTLAIIDADTIARELLSGSLTASATNTLRKVHTLFGPDLFDSAGYLIRHQLRSLIFSSQQKKNNWKICCTR